MRKKPLIIGVTGGIGSGKSVVCSTLHQLGALVISADILAKRIMETHAGIKKKLTKEFGKVYRTNGRLDRKKLADIIFSSPQKKSRIDAIVHPYVFRELKQIIRKAPSEVPLLVIEAALIYESGADKLMHYVIVVDAAEKIRIRRVMKRDGVSREEVLRRLNAQMSAKDKGLRANFVIMNNKNISSLKERVKFIYFLLVKIGEKNGDR